ncbi:6249_t:CDS:2, partial [Racocetra fulgida]
MAATEFSNEISSQKNNNIEVDIDNTFSDETSYDFSLLSIGYTFQSWDKVDLYFKAYGQQLGFAISNKRVEYCDNDIIKHRSFGCEFGKYIILKRELILPPTITDNPNARDLAVQCNDNEIVQWLKTFIDKKKQFLENGQKTNDSKKENLAVANLPITKRKGRPKIKRYKA